MDINVILCQINRVIEPDYYFRLYQLEDLEAFRQLIESSDCHKVPSPEIIDDHTIEVFPILMFDKAGQLLAYLTFSVEESAYVAEPFKFVKIVLTCTGTAFRRRGFSTILRMVPFSYAIWNNIRYIASDTNEASYSLLKKFGFVRSDEYIQDFNYEANAYVDVFATPAIKNAVDNFFKKIR